MSQGLENNVIYSKMCHTLVNSLWNGRWQLWFDDNRKFHDPFTPLWNLAINPWPSRDHDVIYGRPLKLVNRKRYIYSKTFELNNVDLIPISLRTFGCYVITRMSTNGLFFRSIWQNTQKSKKNIVFFLRILFSKVSVKGKALRSDRIVPV